MFPSCQWCILVNFRASKLMMIPTCVSKLIVSNFSVRESLIMIFFIRKCNDKIRLGVKARENQQWTTMVSIIFRLGMLLTLISIFHATDYRWWRHNLWCHNLWQHNLWRHNWWRHFRQKSYIVSNINNHFKIK